MLFIIVENKANNVITLHSFTNHEELVKKPFPADCVTVWILDSETPPKGKTYNIKKKRLQSKAFNYNWLFGMLDNSPSYYEMSIIQGYFEKYGRRYGLLKEFRVNAIC